MPKSISLRTPSSRTITFSGLRSRWMTPASCACASAPASSWTTIAASSGGQEPLPLGEAVAASAPRMYSVTRNASSLDAVGEVEHLEDVGVVELGHRLAPRARAAARSSLAGQVRVQHLHRDLAIERGVEALVHDAHAARAQLLEEPVAPQVPALEAHPRDAPPPRTNARAARNVPHSSGMATEGGMSVSDGPGQRPFSPRPVRAFPASYARFPGFNALTTVEAPERPGGRSGRSRPSTIATGAAAPWTPSRRRRRAVRDPVRRGSGRRRGDHLGLRQVGGRAAVRRAGASLERVGLERGLEHLVHLRDEDELDLVLRLLRDVDRGPCGCARAG